MSSSKTEKATPKKKRDAAKRGQVFKARDMVVACLTFCAGLVVLWLGSLMPLGGVLVDAMREGFRLPPQQYALALLRCAAWVVLPVVFAGVVAMAVPSLLQSRFQLAPEAIKVDFNNLNPARGFKRIFSLRTLKDAGKAVLYLGSFSAAVLLLWWHTRALILTQVYASVPVIIALWQRLVIELLILALACMLAILAIDILIEWFLYLKELRMDKREVRQEHKEMEGDPHMKGHRRQLHLDLLSAQDRHDIQNSRLVVVNPTHVAVGIYFKPELSPVPMVSIVGTNQQALAIRRYAEKIGVAVVPDVALARRMFRSHRRYDPVSLDEIHPIVRLLAWLYEVEAAGCVDDDTVPEDAGKDS